MIKLYASITIGEIDTIADLWLQRPVERLSRLVTRELEERGYGWDPDLGDEENREHYGDLLERVLDSVRAKQRLTLSTGA